MRKERLSFAHVSKEEQDAEEDQDGVSLTVLRNHFEGLITVNECLVMIVKSLLNCVSI